MGSGGSKEEATADLEKRTPGPHNSLSSLRGVPTLYMRQNLPSDLHECCRGNTYSLEDHRGLIRLSAEETPLCNACCGRWWCGPARGFTISLFDTDSDQQILSAERAACRCDWWCCLDCFCCVHRALVKDAEGETVGRVVQKLACGPLLSVEDEYGEVVGAVRGPCCPCRCCCDQMFNLFVLEEEEEERREEEEEEKEKKDVYERMKLDGRIIKRWEAGEVVTEQPRSVGEEEEEKEEKKREYNMDHEHTQIIFPQQADDNHKGLWMGAFFLVHYMYFEMS